MGPTFTVANIDIGPVVYTVPVGFEAYDPVGVEKYETVLFVQRSRYRYLTLSLQYHIHPVLKLMSPIRSGRKSHVIEIKAFDSIGNTTSRRISF